MGEQQPAGAGDGMAKAQTVQKSEERRRDAARAAANANSAKNTTAFQANTLFLLAKLPSAAVPTGFASLRSAGVVAHGLCFGYATPSQCREFLAAAASKLANACGARGRRASIWMDACFAAYADANASCPATTASARASSPAPTRSPPARRPSCRAIAGGGSSGGWLGACVRWPRPGSSGGHSGRGRQRRAATSSYSAGPAEARSGTTGRRVCAREAGARRGAAWTRC
nr:uncharacterized protein LOC109753598 [Aegilops tauschii subsp. strangulata]